MKITRFALLWACLAISLPAFAQEKTEPAAQTQETTEAKKGEAKPEAKADEKKDEAKAVKEDAPKAKKKKAKKDEPKPEEKKPEAADEKPAAEPAPPPEVAKADGTVARAEVVLNDLNNPSGLAIQPETGVVFVADSGNHQIVKLVDGKAEVVITDFPNDVYGKGPMVNIGPLGMLFLNKNTLVIGGGGLPDGEELLRVYELPEDGKPIKADAMKASFKLAETDDVKGEGNFYALAATPEAIFVTCNGDDTKGWVSKATIKDGAVESFERYLATKEATEVDAPVGITVSPDGYLVIGQMGEINVPGDSLITFYDAGSKEMLLNIKTGLHDIAAVAYSKRGQMYVLDYAWADPTQGGLFQIVEDEKSDSGIRTKKLASLDKPTAMVFDTSGNLYVTVIGEATDANSKGQLIKIPASAGL